MPLTRIQILKSGVPLHGSFQVGVFLISLGTLTTLTTLLTDPTNNILLSAALLLRGGIQIFFGQKHRIISYFNSWLINLSATFYITAGAALIDEPDTGSPVLTFILLTCLAFAGMARMFWAFTHRYVRNWSIIAISGSFTFLTGFLLYLSLPWPEPWLLGSLLSLELFVAGTAALIVAATTKPTPSTEP